MEKELKKKTSSVGKKKVKKKISKKKTPQKFNYHTIFFAVVIVLFVFAIVKFLIWNNGESSGYNPDEVTTEFDVETMDHIQH